MLSDTSEQRKLAERLARGDEEEEREEERHGCYLQGLEALQKGLGFVFVLFCSAGIRIGVRPAVWHRMSHRRGAVLFGTVVLLLHFFLGEFILTHRQQAEVRGRRGKRRRRKGRSSEV